MGLPKTGRASTYSDFFVDKPTASGETYHHRNFTAALMTRSNWHALPLGTLVKLTYRGRVIVVKVNDRGKGGGPHGRIDPSRVLDLSRAAMGALLNKPTGAINDKNATTLDNVQIEVVPPGTPVGPQSSK